MGDRRVTNAPEAIMQDQKHIVHGLKEAYRYLQYEGREGALQLNHRIALVNLWSTEPGGHILEVGCGQGETTVALAVAVGPSGHILAVDKSNAAYGRPVTLGESHVHIKFSRLGDRIDFWLSTDLLASQLDFPDKTFDLAIFSHSSWYMSSAQELYWLFARVRPWARRLGYAEWDLHPRCRRQMPHALAVLLQTHVQHVWPQAPPANVRSLILPKDARLSAERAGWRIVNEQVVDTSTPLGYGKSWEIHHAIEMAQQCMDSGMASEDVCRVLLAEKRLLDCFSNEAQNRSLSTYVFLAE